ncbi:ribosomal protein L1 [Thozetella sp. PMI_491]|nr:ribosomal protein L1 [Thozetella sp. PMI_491]
MAKSTVAVPAKAGPASLIDSEQTLKATKALLAHVKKTAVAKSESEKQDLLADDEAPSALSVWLTMTTKIHLKDNRKLQPAKIALPHPLNTDPESTICIVVAEPQRAYKNIVASEEFPEELRKRITRVIDVKHLGAKFKTYEAQRQLFRDHDIFLGDDRIINRLPKILGKTFYKSTTKRPIPVVFQAARERVDGKRVPRPKGKKEEHAEKVKCRPTAEIAAEINKAINSALVHLSPSTNTAIKVGYSTWTASQLAENVSTVAAQLVEKFVPQKWDNVRSFYVKTNESAALPIWQTEELWTEGQVVPDDQAPMKRLDAKAEKANIGKKRKAVEAAEPEAEAQEQPVEEAKPKKKAKKLPESNDGNLDKEIAARKASLRKQKKAARVQDD